MLDEALRQRLEVLNRGTLPADAVATPTAPQPNVPPSRKSPTVGRPIPGILRQGEAVATSAGEHWRIRLPIDVLWPQGSRLVAGRQTHLRERLHAAQRAIEPTAVIDAEFAALVVAMPERMLLLDLETCGLAGCSLFLAGMLHQVDGALAVELLLARNYAEEQAVLESLWQAIERHEVLVTFNGKAFDWPMVVDRSVRYRLEAARRTAAAGPRRHAPPRPAAVAARAARLPAADARTTHLPPASRRRHPRAPHPGRVRRIRPHRLRARHRGDPLPQRHGFGDAAGSLPAFSRVAPLGRPAATGRRASFGGRSDRAASAPVALYSAPAPERDCRCRCRIWFDQDDLARL